MPKKDDLIDAANARGLVLDGNETIAMLEGMIDRHDEHQGDGEGDGEGEYQGDGEGTSRDFEERQPPNVVRAKVTRGSRRRIERAMARLSLDLDEAIKEFDAQVFEADAEGNRTGDWSVVKGLKGVKKGVNDAVNDLLAI